jgi:peptidyl-prolyl cis-trans isomerase A (cyclophilin A)
LVNIHNFKRLISKVAEGQDIVDKINGVSTANHGMHGDVPEDAVIFNKTTIKKITKKKETKKKTAKKQPLL